MAAPMGLGRAVSFTAMAAGGAGSYQFQWLVYDGRRWTVLRGWNSSPQFVWTPTLVNSKYRMRVWVRNQGSTRNDVPDDVKTLDVPVVRR